MDIAELNRLYNQAESCDSDIFAEQRSNVLLVAGEHYNKKSSKFLQRIKDSKELSQEQKLRLTKNHIQKIAKTYVNNITSHAPGVGIRPNNESDLQDQKSAELNNSVWKEIKRRQRFPERRRRWAQNFFTLGEVATKIFYDYSAGRFLGYEQLQDPVTGETSQGNPQFSGDLVWEDVFGFNLLRAPEAKTMSDSPYLIVRKMMDANTLKKFVGEESEKAALIKATKDDTYIIFDGSSYNSSRDQVMLREFFYRPSPQYPEGYYYITVHAGILFEGVLPKGKFPVIYQGFDEVETSPRARSLIKQLRPCQVEINRGASKFAEHQITLGDDKILYQKGATLAPGALLPGVRGVQFSGMPPTVLEGRTGDQYLTAINANIDEIYKLANVFEDSEEKDAQMDPYALLFRTMRNKKRFSLYAEKFEEFLVAVCELSLDLFREFVSPDEAIPIIGKREAVNLSEFKNSSPLCYQISLEAQNDDIESKMGKLLSINHVIQYVGPQLGKDDIGKLISVMPYVNEEQAFSDFTRNYKSVTNEILALDRGEYPPTPQHFDHVYAMGRISARMLESDFALLPPAIQQNYQRKLKEHEFFESEAQRKIMAAKADYIPTDGYFVVCDYYVTDPKDPLKKNRVKVPSRAIEWLIQRMTDQGNSAEQMLAASPDVQSQYASFLNQEQGLTGLPPQPGPMPNLGGLNVS